jgi:CheY-like chemotaxis protein
MNAIPDDKPERILLVETDVLARYPLAAFLRECGYVVVEAATTDEALSVLNAPDMNFAAALIDAKAKGKTGAFALAQRIRDEKPETDVILAGSTPAAVEKAADLCAEGPGISKPYNHAAVLDLIKRLRAARGRG